MKIFSHYLEADLEMEVYTVEGVSGFLVPHKELRRIVNELTVPLSVCSEMLVSDAEKGVFAILVTVSDGTKKAMEIGEANKSNLCSQISQQYPITMAYARGFDRAIIAFLALDEKVMSDFEVKVALSQIAPEPEKVVTATEPEKEKVETPVKKPEAPAKKSETAVKESKADDDFDVEFEDDGEDVVVDVNGKKKEPKPVAVIDDSDEELTMEGFDEEAMTEEAPTEDYGDTVIIAGAHKGKTLADMLKAGDKRTLKWFTTITLGAVGKAEAEEFRRRATAFWEANK